MSRYLASPNDARSASARARMSASSPGERGGGGGGGVGGGALDRTPGKENRARGGLVYAGDQVEDGGLPRPVRPDQTAQHPSRQIEIEIADGLDAPQPHPHPPPS